MKDKRRVIFLDVDGVLNNDESLVHAARNGWGPFALDPDLVSRLKVIVATTGAEVVLSSTWRILDEHLRLLRVALWTHRIAIKDTTPVRHDRPRGYEIEEWLDAERDAGCPVDKFVILDDDTDMLDWQQSNFVNTNRHIGLTEEDVAKAIHILLGIVRSRSHQP